jgi:hypothetical protein
MVVALVSIFCYLASLLRNLVMHNTHTHTQNHKLSYYIHSVCWEEVHKLKEMINHLILNKNVTLTCVVFRCLKFKRWICLVPKLSQMFINVLAIKPLNLRFKSIKNVQIVLHQQQYTAWLVVAVNWWSSQEHLECSVFALQHSVLCVWLFIFTPNLKDEN